MPEYDFEGYFEATTEFVSQSVELNNRNVLRAKIICNTAAFSPSVDSYSFFLTNNGGSTWEEAELNKNHVFSSTGQDVRYKIVGPSGGTITIRQSNGADYPIIIDVKQ